MMKNLYRNSSRKMKNQENHSMSDLPFNRARCENLVEDLISEFPIAIVLRTIVQTIEENRGYAAFPLKYLAENIESALIEYEDSLEQDNV